MNHRFIVGNWKMHGTQTEGAALADRLRRALGPVPPGVRVVVCPPFTALDRVATALEGSGLGLGAQDVFWEDAGAFTGEVSAPMLAAVGCRHVVVGHSERRFHLGETDAMVARKLGACWRHGLEPILCVGETAEERAADATAQRLRAQVEAALAAVGGPRTLAVAYEPVWAIGGGRAARPEDCAAGLAVVRQVLRDLWGEAARAVACLYGGSVNPQNCRAFWKEGGADGLLIGGASLDAEAFAAICRQAAGEGAGPWSR
jgi:triosephosphate isomerase